MSEDLEGTAEFLQADGGAEILLAVDPGEGSIHSEVTEKIPMAGDTVRKRLETAVELDLLELSRGEAEDHGNVKRYYLTQFGRAILMGMVSLNLDEKILEYYELQEQIAADIDGLKTWLTSEEADIIFNDPSTSAIERTEQLTQGNAYPGEDLPRHYDLFVAYTEEDYERTRIGNIQDYINYDRF